MKTNEPLRLYYQELDRGFFMGANSAFARYDRPFPIGYGQTISQPSLVLFMTESLDITSNHKVLEVGTGSGYQTALLAKFAKEVYTIERIEPLLALAKERLLELGFDNIHYILGDGTYGDEDDGPFDRIIVTAAANEIPGDLLDQLNVDGIMIIPVGETYVQDLLLIKKDNQENLTIDTLEQVRFVPLIGDCSI
jgi:protein-L-isoaspartate(D-aspartate) O-methyltransferase